MAMKVVVFAILLMAIIMPATAFAQNATSFTMDKEERSGKGDVIMLSQRYNNEEYGDEIVGEVKNNGSVPVDFVQITVTFYDENHNITGTDFTFSDPYTLVPGMKAPFKFYLTDGSSTEDADTYEYSLSWNNPDGTTGSKVISQKLLTHPDDDNDGEDSSDNSGNGNDNGERNCDASYPTVCIKSPPPNLNCDDVPYNNFKVTGRDPHGFDGDNDGFGCDSAKGDGDGNGNGNKTKPPICPVNREGECPPVPPIDPPDPCNENPDAEECDGERSEGNGGGDGDGGDGDGGDGDGGDGDGGDGDGGDGDGGDGDGGDILFG